MSPSSRAIRPRAGVVPRVGSPPEVDVADAALEALLHDVYVAEGYTAPELARSMFTAAAVRARGDLFLATDGGALVGLLIVAWGGSASCRLASAGEAELHLLGVDRAWRGHGVASVLLSRALERIRERACRAVVLWTQPEMRDARELYRKVGFVPCPHEDFERNGRRFLVYRLPLA